MNKIIILLAVSFGVSSVQAQNISTIAGNGVAGYNGDGRPATAAEINGANTVTADAAGNVYITDYGNNRIRKVTHDSIFTIAGNGTSGYSGDGGPATAAEINHPIGIIVDNSGNIYFGDYDNNRVRKISTAGIITTIAGNGNGYGGDGGLATAAGVTLPAGVAVDNKGNVYIPEYHESRIRKINTSGIITTIAGNGIAGYSGDGGQATAAEINASSGVWIDVTGNMYIADLNNNRIRKVNTSGIISTVIGTGVAGYSGDGGNASAAELNLPSNIVFDAAGNMYISDIGNNVIRMVSTSGIISTYAGNGIAGFSGDGGPATAAEFNDPHYIAIDGSNNIFIADHLNNRIRKVNGSPDTNKSSWTAVAAFPGTCRTSPVSFTIGHFAYVGMGNSGTTYFNDFWRWNQHTNTWTSVASFPGAGLRGCSGFTINGKGYICLGGNGPSQNNFSTQLWEYDSTSNSWTQKASFPGSPRDASFSFVLNGKAYLGTGWTGGPPYANDFWVYDPIADKWAQLGNYPGGNKTGVFGFAIGNNGYAGGGIVNSSSFSNDCWKYYPATDTWVSINSLPVPTGGMEDPVSFVIGTKGYVGTGNISVSGPLTRDFWAYDTLTDSWSSVPSLTGIGRDDATGFAIGKYGYVSNGIDSVQGVLCDFWQYGDTSKGILTAIVEMIHANAEMVKVFPNPGNGIFNVTYSGVNSNKSMFILADITGRTLDTYSLNGKEGVVTINKSSLSNGIYFYQFVSEGKAVKTGKIIITK